MVVQEPTYILHLEKYRPFNSYPIRAVTKLVKSLCFCCHTSVFLIRSYGAPNGAGRCPVAQCYGNTWATLAQSKIKLGQYCQLVVALLDVGS